MRPSSMLAKARTACRSLRMMLKLGLPLPNCRRLASGKTTSNGVEKRFRFAETRLFKAADSERIGNIVALCKLPADWTDFFMVQNSQTHCKGFASGPKRQGAKA